MTRYYRPTHAEVALSASLIERAAALRSRADRILTDWTLRGTLVRASEQCRAARDTIADNFDASLAVLEAASKLLDAVDALDLAGDILTTSEPTA